MISNILTFAWNATSWRKASRVGNGANFSGHTTRYMSMIQPVFFMFQGRQRLLRQLHLACKLLRRPPLRLRRHHCRLPRQDLLARASPQVSSSAAATSVSAASTASCSARAFPQASSVSANTPSLKANPQLCISYSHPQLNITEK